MTRRRRSIAVWACAATLSLGMAGCHLSRDNAWDPAQKPTLASDDTQTQQEPVVLQVQLDAPHVMVGDVVRVLCSATRDGVAAPTQTQVSVQPHVEVSYIGDGWHTFKPEQTGPHVVTCVATQGNAPEVVTEVQVSDPAHAVWHPSLPGAARAGQFVGARCVLRDALGKDVPSSQQRRFSVDEAEGVTVTANGMVATRAGTYTLRCGTQNSEVAHLVVTAAAPYAFAQSPQAYTCGAPHQAPPSPPVEFVDRFGNPVEASVVWHAHAIDPDATAPFDPESGEAIFELEPEVHDVAEDAQLSPAVVTFYRDVTAPKVTYPKAPKFDLPWMLSERGPIEAKVSDMSGIKHVSGTAPDSLAQGPIQVTMQHTLDTNAWGLQALVTEATDRCDNSVSHVQPLLLSDKFAALDLQARLNDSADPGVTVTYSEPMLAWIAGKLARPLGIVSTPISQRTSFTPASIHRGVFGFRLPLLDIDLDGRGMAVDVDTRHIRVSLADDALHLQVHVAQAHFSGRTVDGQRNVAAKLPGLELRLTRPLTGEGEGELHAASDKPPVLMFDPPSGGQGHDEQGMRRNKALVSYAEVVFKKSMHDFADILLKALRDSPKQVSGEVRQELMGGTPAAVMQHVALRAPNGLPAHVRGPIVMPKPKDEARVAVDEDTLTVSDDMLNEALWSHWVQGKFAVQATPPDTTEASLRLPPVVRYHQDHLELSFAIDMHAPWQGLVVGHVPIAMTYTDKGLGLQTLTTPDARWEIRTLYGSTETNDTHITALAWLQPLVSEALTQVPLPTAMQEVAPPWKQFHQSRRGHATMLEAIGEWPE